jgi:hypothetical protein
VSARQALNAGDDSPWLLIMDHLLKTKPSQTQMILDYMNRHGSITPREALNTFNCFRLGARIWELKRKGYAIQVINVTENGKTYAKYSLTKCNNGQYSFL